jgi:GAF domain-containing protein
MQQREDRTLLALLAISLLTAGGLSLAAFVDLQLTRDEPSVSVLAALASPVILPTTGVAILALGFAAYRRLRALCWLNRQLVGRLQAQHQTVLRFGQLSHRLVTEADLDSLLELVLEGAMEVTEAETGSLMLLDESQEVMRIITARGLPQDVVMNTSLRLGEGIAGLVAQRGEPVVLGPSTKDPQLVALMKRHDQIRAAISAPVLLEGRVVGVVNVNRAKRGDEFEEYDAEALCAFAGHAALAIDKARVYGRLREQRAGRPESGLTGCGDSATTGSR